MNQNHKAQQKINHYWNQRAEKYHSFQVSTDRAIVDKQVWENIFRDAIGQSQRVLDVGTGSGFVAHLLADAGYSVQGIDLSSEMIRIARAHVVPEQRDQHSALDSSGGSASFSLGDALDPPFMPQSFDAVVSRYVMWTLREPTEAMRNWARLLVPGGRLAVVDAPWFPDGIDENPTEHFAEIYDSQVREALPLAERVSIESTVEVIKNAGFDDVQFRPLNEIYELDQKLGTVPGHQPTLQYLITARRPR